MNTTWNFSGPQYLFQPSVSHHLNHKVMPGCDGGHGEIHSSQASQWDFSWVYDLHAPFLAFQGFLLRDEKPRASYKAVFFSLVLGPLLLASWCNFHCGHCTPGWCCLCTQDVDCARREPVQILTSGKLFSGLVQSGDSRIKVLCVETNACLKKKSNLVVFNASVVACCKESLCTELASVGPLLLALLQSVFLQRSYKSQEHLLVSSFKQILHPRGWRLEDFAYMVRFSFLHLNTTFYLQSNSSSYPDGKPACLANITFNLLQCAAFQQLLVAANSNMYLT